MSKQKSKNFKKIFIISIFMVLVIGISATIEKIVESSNKYEMNSIDGISMVIKENTLTKTGMSVVIIDTTNYKNVYGGSCDYRIDRRLNNKWEEVKKIKNFPSYLQSSYVDENNKLEIDIDWSKTYGELEKGEYRLVKSTEIENKVYEFSVEFEIS